MDHVVYLDASAREMEGILGGEKTMIIRGATGRKMPYGRLKQETCYISEQCMQGLVKRGIALGSCTQII